MWNCIYQMLLQLKKKSEKVLVDIEPMLESLMQDCMEVALDHAATVPVII